MSDSSNKGDPSTSDGIEMIQKPSAIPVVENSTNDSDPNLAASLDDINLDVEFADDAMIITKIQTTLKEHGITNKKQLDSIVIQTATRIAVLNVKIKSFIEYRIVCNSYRQHLGTVDTYKKECEKINKKDVICSVPGAFVDKIVSKVIPNSDEVVVCKTCQGSGHEKCPDCRGSGTKRMIVTLPNKKQETITSKCVRCDGNGFLTCSYCHERGKVVMFRTVHVYFKTVYTNTFSHLTEYELNRKLCKVALGKKVYSEEGESITFNCHSKSPILKDLIDKARVDHKKEMEALSSDFVCHHELFQVDVIPVIHAVVTMKKMSFKINCYGLSQRIEIVDLNNVLSSLQSCCCITMWVVC